MDARFWAGRRVLVTGHTGFKGSWLALWLARLGAQVTGFSLAPPSPLNLYEQARVREVVTSVHGDVRDRAHLARTVIAADPEVVFHLAAQSLVRASHEDPLGTYATNVLGTATVLEAVRGAASVRAVVIVSSDKCYADPPGPSGHREDARLGGDDPYASSKACAELVTQAYRRSFFAAERHREHGVAVASARAGNTIGGGDWAKDRLVPDAIRAFLSADRLLVRNPHAVRPWQHVLEALAGYLLLAERLVQRGPEFAEAWNFGPPPDQAITVGELVTRLERSWGGPASHAIAAEPGAPAEASVLRLDAGKAQSRLGWRSVMSVHDALHWTVEWYRAVHRGDDARTVTEAQLERYLRAVSVAAAPG